MLHMFLVKRAVWGVLMNSCMWATVHFGRNEDQFKRILRNMEVRKTKTCRLKVRDQEIYGQLEDVNGSHGYWRKSSSLDEQFSEQLKNKKCTCSAAHLHVLVVNTLIIAM